MSTSGTVSPPWEPTIRRPWCNGNESMDIRSPANGTPLNTVRPLSEVASYAACRTAFTPVVSTAASKPRPFDSSASAALKSVPSTFTVWVAPNLFEYSSFSALLSIATTGYALTRAAPWTTLSPTPPTPKMAIDCPGLSPTLLNTIPSPVLTAHPNSAVTSNPASLLTGARRFSDTLQFPLTLVSPPAPSASPW